MTTITKGEWIADLETMTCRNVLNKVVVVFEMRGNKPLGKIKDMSMDLFAKLSMEPYGEEKMAKLVRDAEEVFLRAYTERQLKK